MSGTDESRGLPRSFPTTRWSVVRAAGAADSETSRAALETLCGDYWYPLYAFSRHRGMPDEDARDLVQGFLAQLLEKRDLGGADPERGRFRSYLLGAMKHFLSHERERAGARKRGGDVEILPLDFGDAADRYAREPLERMTPERLFERQWAVLLLERAVQRLAREYAARGQEELFEGLAPFLTGDEGGDSRSELGRNLGLSRGAVDVAVHRLRKRYRAAVRREISDTVDGPEQVDEELRALRAALED